MKSIVFFIFSLLSMSVFSQTGRTLKVEKLSQPENFLSTQSIKDIYEGLIVSDISVNHNDIKKDQFPFGIVAKSELPASLVSFGYHSFFNGMYQAYADHRPFVLSPDMVWLLISQGFAHHVNVNPESLRHHFVDFRGKISLLVTTKEVTLDNPQSPWEKIFPEFTNQLAEHVGSEFINLLSSDFSTTTPVEKVASQITIMETMKTYFEYIIIRIVCGIPEITLQGTTKDWQKILDKTKQLGKYDLTWWTNELTPILEEFVKASKGRVNKKFWRGMFNYHSKSIPCGGPITTIDGWIVKFFPYNNQGGRNNLYTLSNSKNLPEEIVKVDVNFIDNETGLATPLELWTGFVGLEQNMKNYALTPKIGWMIRKKDVEQVALQQKFEDDLKTNGRIAIRVKLIPEAIYQLKEIQQLNIQFVDSVDIPDRLADVKINGLNIEGKIKFNKSEYARIRQLFPDTEVKINNKSIDALIEEGDATNSPFTQSFINAMSNGGDVIKSPEVSSPNPKPTDKNKSAKMKKRKVTEIDEAENNGSALVIIDEKEGGDITKINPENIATFKILTGIDATSIYGKKGVNGVVIITTK